MPAILFLSNDGKTSILKFFLFAFIGSSTQNLKSLLNIFSDFALDVFPTTNVYKISDIPNLKGTWIGKNNTLSNQRGFRTWEKKVEILEQDEPAR